MPKVTFGAAYPGRIGYDIVEFAQWIEGLGWDGVWCTDGATGPDCFVLLSAAAAATKKVQLGTCVALVPLRNPYLMAKTVGTLDSMSGGRFVFGIGVGGERPWEWEAFNVPIEERGSRCNEYLEIMKTLWTASDKATYQGKHHSFKDVPFSAKPAQAGGPPIWVGGRSGGRDKSKTAALRRTGKYGDGFFPYLCTPEQYRDWFNQIADFAKGYGRDPNKIDKALLAFAAIYDTHEESHKVSAYIHGVGYRQNFENLVDKYDILGPSKDAIKRLEQFVETAGVNHIVFNWACNPQDIKGNIEIISKEVIPHFR